MDDFRRIVAWTPDPTLPPGGERAAQPRAGLRLADSVL